MRLGRLGYSSSRQAGSHLRLTRTTESHQHHVTVPRHHALRLGTLAAILDDVAAELNITRDALLGRLFG
ncbi:MAG TPA: type II toxin-antitoxin system HicA family toxin [Thermoanaerobaculia bacterium]|nr:type II toxin-antitoxin system HicA family toxin [Thermoanaerobaculia bacterium]